MSRVGRVIGRWWAAWCAIVRREVPEAADAPEEGAAWDRERWERVYYEQALELERLRALNRLLDQVRAERRRVHHHRPRRRRAATQSRRA